MIVPGVSGEGEGRDIWNAANGEERKERWQRVQEQKEEGVFFHFHERTVWCTAVSILTEWATGSIHLMVQDYPTQRH